MNGLVKHCSGLVFTSGLTLAFAFCLVSSQVLCCNVKVWKMRPSYSLGYLVMESYDCM